MSFEETLAIYDRVVAVNPNLQRKGKAVPSTMANRRMFTMMNKDGQLGIRLSKEEGKAFIEKHEGSGPFKSHGATMQEYVWVPDTMLKDEKLLGKYIQQAYEYIMSLPPKD